MEKGFSTSQDDELQVTELRLGMPGTDRPQKTVPTPCGANAGKRALVDESEERSNPSKPTKSQVVGWPPVRSSFRRNVLESTKKTEEKQSPPPPASTTTTTPAHFIKVSMDGAPFLRKVDINVLKGYKDLRLALDAMFKFFDTTSADLSVTYEDKDGDWMLVGDVPWEMFTDSCRRLRIMKGSEAKGLNLAK